MRYLSFCFLLVVTMSCTSQKDKTNEEVKSNLELANRSFNENKLDTAAVRNAETAIGKYIQAYPQDSLASDYLFELGMLYQKQRKFDQAINAFDKVYREYPDSKHARNAVFLQGFLYANVLNNLDKAKEMYQLYLDKYSAADEKMTNDVQLELKNLGKTPDELLREIQGMEAVKDSL
jgi:tetratricopeptide (TPR) repeat protein